MCSEINVKATFYPGHYLFKAIIDLCGSRKVGAESLSGGRSFSTLKLHAFYSCAYVGSFSI